MKRKTYTLVLMSLTLPMIIPITLSSCAKRPDQPTDLAFLGSQVIRTYRMELYDRDLYVVEFLNERDDHCVLVESRYDGNVTLSCLPRECDVN